MKEDGEEAGEVTENPETEVKVGEGDDVNIFL